MNRYLASAALILGIAAAAPAGTACAADLSWAFSRFENGEALFNIVNTSADKKVFALAWHGTFFIDGKKYVFERSQDDKLRLNYPLMPGGTHVLRLRFDAGGKIHDVFMDKLWWDYEQLSPYSGKR